MYRKSVSEEQSKIERDTKVYTYDEAVELTGHGSYNYLLLAACSIITNAAALDMFGFSITVAAAACDLRLGLAETGILASAPFVGVVFAFPWGYLADTRGRRRTLLLSSLTGFVFAAAASFSPSWQLMMVCKVIACSFTNACYTLTITILGECTGCSRRSQYLFIMNSANMLSECFSFGLAYFLLPLQFDLPIPFLGISYQPWRLFTFALALPLGIGGLMMAYLHESPKFLASRGNNKRALEVLRSIHEWNGGRKGEYQVQQLLTTDDTVDQNISFWDSVVKQTVPVFKPPLLWRTLQIFYLMAICASTNNAFVMWYPTIVNIFFNSLSDDLYSENTFCARISGSLNTSMTHQLAETDNLICSDVISSSTIISGVLYGLFFCGATLVTSRFASRRRLVLVSWLLVSAVSTALVDLRQPAASLVFFVLLQASVIGAPSLAAYCVDLYPTSYRGLMTSLSMMVARLCSLGGVNLVGALITNYCSLTFYGWSVFVFSGIIVSLFLPSDMKMNLNTK